MILDDDDTDICAKKAINKHLLTDIPYPLLLRLLYIGVNSGGTGVDHIRREEVLSGSCSPQKGRL